MYIINPCRPGCFGVRFRKKNTRWLFPVRIFCTAHFPQDHWSRVVFFVYTRIDHVFSTLFSVVFYGQPMTVWMVSVSGGVLPWSSRILIPFPFQDRALNQGSRRDRTNPMEGDPGSSQLLSLLGRDFKSLFIFVRPWITTLCLLIERVLC
jgi:hypothetical protein